MGEAVTSLEDEIAASWTRSQSGLPMTMTNGRVQLVLPEIEPTGESWSPDESPTAAQQTPQPGAPAPSAVANPSPGNAQAAQGLNKPFGELRSVDPTLREDGRAWTQEFFEGVGVDRHIARDFAEKLWGTTNPVSPNGIGALDVLLVPGAVMGLDESLRQIEDGITGMQAGRDGAVGQAAMGLGFALMNALGLGAASKAMLPKLQRMIESAPAKIEGEAAAALKGAN